MEKEDAKNTEALSPEEKSEIIRSWFEKYEIKRIVVSRPDVVFYLEE